MGVHAHVDSSDGAVDNRSILELYRDCLVGQLHKKPVEQVIQWKSKGCPFPLLLWILSVNVEQKVDSIQNLEHDQCKSSNHK